MRRLRVKLEGCIVLNKHNTVFARSGPLYATGVILLLSTATRCFPGPTIRRRKRHLDRFSRFCKAH